MAGELAQINDRTSALESVVISGDLGKLSSDERVAYYRAVCESVGLNPFTQPFQYITLSGKLTLYARKDATEQLRRLHDVSVRITARDMHEAVGVYVVTAQASMANGRTDEATGAVTIKNLSGENLANALMKAETKAKRRATLSICGLGMLDEAEADTVPGSRVVHVDNETGEISPPRPAALPSPEPTSTTRREPPKPKPGYVAAAEAKQRLVKAFTDQGISDETAKASAKELWGPRGREAVTEEHLAQMLAQVAHPDLPDENTDDALGLPFDDTQEPA